MTKRLSDANYTSRRLKLVGNVNAAIAAHEDVAFRLELAECSAAEVRAAKESVDELQARLGGLDAAWRRELDQRQQDGADVIAQQREHNVERMASLMKDRAAAANGVEKAMADLTASLRSLDEAESGLRAQIVSVRHLGVRGEPDSSVFHRALFSIGHSWVEQYIIGELHRANHDYSALNWNTAAWHTQSRTRSLTEQCEAENSNVLQGLYFELPELEAIEVAPHHNTSNLRRVSDGPAPAAVEATEWGGFAPVGSFGTRGMSTYQAGTGDGSTMGEA